jgi:hypothetical protein
MFVVKDSQLHAQPQNKLEVFPLFIEMLISKHTLQIRIQDCISTDYFLIILLSFKYPP